MFDSSMKPLKWISNTSLFSINFKWRDLIGAIHIPVAPRFVVLTFPRPFFEGRGVGRRETRSGVVSPVLRIESSQKDRPTTRLIECLGDKALPRLVSTIWWRLWEYCTGQMVGSETREVFPSMRSGEVSNVPCIPTLTGMHLSNLSSPSSPLPEGGPLSSSNFPFWSELSP